MEKNKEDKILLLNTISPLLLEIVTFIGGFIVPRLILSHYGSEVNGLVQSITQFLSIISFMEMGVGSVIRYNLYKPLYIKDNEKISKVIVSANKFFKTIAMLLLGYTFLLIIIFPCFVQKKFDSVYTAMLIVAMCISYFSQYFFGQVNQILLTADQRGYIHFCAQAITVILNTIACVVLIELGVGIHIIKLTTSIIYLFRPLYLQWYVRTNYKINYQLKYDEEPIKQKWNGMAQHVSAVVLDQTDVIVLTVLSTLSNVSIYATYNMIIAGIKKLVTTSTSGIQVKLGAIIAKENNNELNGMFSIIEWLIHSVSIFMFACTAILIVPFVLVYTRGINDVNYDVRIFAVLLTFANACHCLRLPYSILVLAAGHYRQTQNSYWFAASVNIVISCILVYRYGLLGVTIGTIAAMIYHTVWMACYCYKNILSQEVCTFWKQIGIDMLTIGVIGIVYYFFKFRVVNYIEWAVYAVIVSIIVASVVIIINLVFYRDYLVRVINHLFMKKKESSKNYRKVI